MMKIQELVARCWAGIVRDWKALALIAGVILAIAIWLLTRDGYNPEESSGKITITNSRGEVISVLLEPQNTSTEDSNEK